MKELNGTGPVASPIDATRCPAPPAMSSSTTGGPCSRKSALPAQKAATASGVERSRTKVTRAGSRPWRRRTACMQSHGVGAPPNEITVRRTGVTVGAVYAAVLLSQEGSSNHALDVLEREGLLEPRRSDPLEELPGPRVEDVAGHEDEAPGQARLAPFHLPVELRATHHGHA